MSHRRLFFALWLPGAVAEALYSQASALTATGGGRVMRPETMHLTLAFLGDVAEERVAELAAIGARVAAQRPPFTAAIDCLGHWSHNRIDWAGCRVVPPELDALVADLRAALGLAGFPSEPRAFVPHVTLVRKRTSNLLPDDFAVHRVRVDELRLVESRRGPPHGGYVPLARWPLADVGGR